MQFQNELLAKVIPFPSRRNILRRRDSMTDRPTDTSLIERQHYPICRHCGRVILGAVYFSSYVNGKRPYRKAAEKSVNAGSWRLYHLECTFFLYAKERPDTTFGVATVEKSRRLLEIAISFREDSQKSVEKSKREIDHAIWTAYHRRLRLLKDWYYCSSAPKDVTPGSPKCFGCGNEIHDDPYTCAVSNYELGVRKIRKGQRGLHRNCAEEWARTQQTDIATAADIEQARAIYEKCQKELAVQEHVVRQCEVNMTAAIQHHKAQTVVSFKQ